MDILDFITLIHYVWIKYFVGLYVCRDELQAFHLCKLSSKFIILPSVLMKSLKKNLFDAFNCSTRGR